MAAILQAAISKTFSGQKIFWTAVKISWNFVPKGPQGSGNGLAQKGDKPLPESMLTTFHDVITRP